MKRRVFEAEHEPFRETKRLEIAIMAIAGARETWRQTLQNEPDAQPQQPEFPTGDGDAVVEIVVELLLFGCDRR